MNFHYLAKWLYGARSKRNYTPSKKKLLTFSFAKSDNGFPWISANQLAIPVLPLVIPKFANEKARSFFFFFASVYICILHRVLHLNKCSYQRNFTSKRFLWDLDFRASYNRLKINKPVGLWCWAFSWNSNYVSCLSFGTLCVFKFQDKNIIGFCYLPLQQ